MAAVTVMVGAAVGAVAPAGIARGGMIDLGTLGGSSSEAAAVKDWGQVVGSSGTPAGDGHAVLWKREPH